MTTGPRPTPHPIILHVDATGNPVRLAEASGIYVASATILSATITTLSATTYLGLNFENAGLPGGSDGQVQYRKSATEFAGDSGFTYNEADSLLNVTQLQANNFSSLYGTFLNNLTRAEEFSSLTVSTVNSRIGTLSATTISAITVCATNYNSLFDSLSFTNLDSRYLNSSGESVTGSFFLENLSGATFSATTYLNLPSGAAVWNASALAGKPVTSTAPGQYEVLVYNGAAWVPSSIDVLAGVGSLPGGPAGSVQFKSGSTFVGSSTVKYNESISGLELVNTSSVNLSSTYITAITVSSANYLNIPSGTAIWNANKVADVTITKVPIGDWGSRDILALQAGSLQRTPSTDYAYWVLDEVQPTIYANLPQTNASSIRGVSVTSTTPTTNNVLVYTGSVWAPSSAISLATITATNLGGTNIVGFSAAVTHVSSAGLSATNFSATSARVIGLSATTLSSTNWYGLPSSVALWNASAINGANVVTVSPQVTGSTLGTFVYNQANAEYLTLPFSSTALAGTRNYAVSPPQGQIVASYLGSATPSLQINPYFNTTAVLGSIDLPQNKDVLVFSSDLYGYGFGGGWTWEQPSALIPTVPPVTAAGGTGSIQFRGPDGEFSAVSHLYYASNGNFTASNVYILDSASINTPWVTFRDGFRALNNASLQGNFSAVTYTLFEKQTSSTGSPTPTQDNQTITYDLNAQKWKPGFAIYQATALPDNSDGKNGDIYFRYIP